MFILPTCLSFLQSESINSSSLWYLLTKALTSERLSFHLFPLSNIKSGLNYCHLLCSTVYRIMSFISFDFHWLSSLFPPLYPSCFNPLSNDTKWRCNYCLTLKRDNILIIMEMSNKIQIVSQKKNEHNIDLIVLLSQQLRLSRVYASLNVMQ